MSPLFRGAESPTISPTAVRQQCSGLSQFRVKVPCAVRNGHYFDRVFVFDDENEVIWKSLHAAIPQIGKFRVRAWRLRALRAGPLSR